MNFSVVLLVNNSLSGRVGCFFLALQLTIMSLDTHLPFLHQYKIAIDGQVCKSQTCGNKTELYCGLGFL